MGTGFGGGSKFLLFYVKRVPRELPETDVIGLDFGKPMDRRFEIDYAEHEKKCIDGMTKSIVKGFNLYETATTLDFFNGDK